MRAQKFSQAPLLVGLALALTALWAGGAPFGGIVEGIGGWTTCYTYYGDVACGGGGPCYWCTGTYWAPCTDGSGPRWHCSGNGISVASCSSSEDDGTTMAGSQPCWSDWPGGGTDCDNAGDAWCNGAWGIGDVHLFQSPRPLSSSWPAESRRVLWAGLNEGA